jgi:hypothetical protein
MHNKTFMRTALCSVFMISVVVFLQFADYRRELADAKLRRDLAEHGVVAKSTHSEYRSTRGGCEIKFVIGQPNGGLYHNSYRPLFIECLEFEKQFIAGNNKQDIIYEPTQMYRAMPLLNGGIRQRDVSQSLQVRIRNTSVVLGLALPLIFLMFWQYRREELRGSR